MLAELFKNCEPLARFIDTESNVPIVLIDEQQRISDCNYGFLKQFSLSNKPVGAAVADFLIPCGEGAGFRNFTCNPKTGVHGVLMAHCLPYENGQLLWCERPLNTNNQVVEQVALLNNEFIAIQRELDKKNHHLNRIQLELEEKVVQLESALSQVKQLEGVIPICMYCKNIRDDKELWHKLEQYISDHTDALFSHGICPVCFEEHFGEISRTTK